MTCTFFGHRDTPATDKPILRQVIIDLIEQRGVTHFYVGNQGNFDAMARSLLAELAQIYPIRYDVVLAYLPKENDPSLDESHMLLPDGFEAVPPRFAAAIASARRRSPPRSARRIVQVQSAPRATSSAQP